MAGADGRRGVSLIDRLYQAPYQFDVRQAVRLLEYLAPRAAPLAAGDDPAREAVRLRASLTRSFPASDIESLRPGGFGAPAEMVVTFMGLAGPFGPLPPPLSERVIERARRGDASARDFLDIFHHRLVALLLRQWRLVHPALQGRPQRPEMPARLPLLAVLGLATLPADGGPASPEGRLGGLMPGLLQAAGLLHPRPVSAHALERLLAGYFGLPVRVASFGGAWLPLAAGQRSRLGPDGAMLGRVCVIGTRVWDQAGGLAVSIGPMAAARLGCFLPGREAHRQTARLLALTVGEGVAVSLTLEVAAAEVPAARFGRPRPGRPGTRLGWTSWLGQRPRRDNGVVRVLLAPERAGAV